MYRYNTLHTLNPAKPCETFVRDEMNVNMTYTRNNRKMQLQSWIQHEQGKRSSSSHHILNQRHFSNFPHNDPNSHHQRRRQRHWTLSHTPFLRTRFQGVCLRH